MSAITACAVVTGVEAVERQAQSDRPAVGAFQQAAARRLVVAAGRFVVGHERAHLVEREAQLALPELGQLVVRTQPRQRGERRLGAAGDDDAPVRRQPFQQQVEELEHRRVGDAVRVVEHDQAALDVAGGEHVEQLRRHAVAIGAGPGGGRDQRVGIGAPRRVERLERGDQAGEQAERIVVDVGRDPGDRGTSAQALDQPRQRRGLAEAGRRREQHQAPAERRARHPLLEAVSRHQARAGARRLDLGQCEALRLRSQGRPPRSILRASLAGVPASAGATMRPPATRCPTMTSATEMSSFEGGCTCRAVRYRLESRPLFVNCCHCTWCQRETGSAFAVNAMIEADRVSVLAGEPEKVMTPSASGSGQTIARCPVCRVALWSNYAGAGESVRFVRVGTLDEPARLPPDIHIFTSTKQPWVVLPAGVPAVPEYYDSKQYWPAESLERRRALRARAGR